MTFNKEPNHHLGLWSREACLGGLRCGLGFLEDSENLGIFSANQAQGRGGNRQCKGEVTQQLLTHPTNFQEIEIVPLACQNRILK